MMCRFSEEKKKRNGDKGWIVTIWNQDLLRWPVATRALSGTMGACLQFLKSASSLGLRSEERDALPSGAIVSGVADVHPATSVTLPGPHLEIITNTHGEAFVYCRPCRLFLCSKNDFTEELWRDHKHCKRHRRHFGAE